MDNALFAEEEASARSNATNTRHVGIGRTRQQGWRTGVSEPANPMLSDNDDDSSEGGDGRMELEEEEMIPFTLTIGLPLGTLRDDIHMVLSRMRDNVLQHIESGHFDTNSLNVRNGSWAIRCDAQFKRDTLEMVGDDENHMEYVLHSLEQWLMTMLDMRVQGINITIPWMAGAWSINWHFIYEL